MPTPTPTWDDLRAALHAAKLVRRDAGTELFLAMPEHIHLALDGKWLLLGADLGAEDVLDVRAALAMNERLRVGALATTRGHLVLRRCTGLLPAEDLLRLLRLFAAEVASLSPARRPHDLTFCDGYALP